MPLPYWKCAAIAVAIVFSPAAAILAADKVGAAELLSELPRSAMAADMQCRGGLSIVSSMVVRFTGWTMSNASLGLVANPATDRESAAVAGALAASWRAALASLPCDQETRDRVSFGSRPSLEILDRAATASR